MSQFYISMAGGGAGFVSSLAGNTGTASPALGIINVVGTGVAANGISTAGNLYTVGAGNTITINETQGQFLTNYTTVNFAMSPYSALPTDYFMSVDTSGGSVSIILPAAPGSFRIFVVKDRTGNAGANNIVVSSAGGNTVELAASFAINGNFESANFAFAGTNYETW